jgi:hypothetical protein
MRRELYSWHGLERTGRLRWGYRCAIVKARMETWRWGFSHAHPTVEIHQDGAQQRPVVDRVGPLLTARVTCRTAIGQLEIAGAVLRPGQVIDPHRSRPGSVLPLCLFRLAPTSAPAHAAGQPDSNFLRGCFPSAAL